MEFVEVISQCSTPLTSLRTLILHINDEFEWLIGAEKVYFAVISEFAAGASIEIGAHTTLLPETWPIGNVKAAVPLFETIPFTNELEFPSFDVAFVLKLINPDPV